MDIKQKKIAFISLGCDKNRVDLEEMMFDLSSFGFKFCNSKDAQIAVVNTCAFILPARQESINNILEMVALKNSGSLENIVVTGCLCQRYKEELEKYIPEVDAFVEVKNNKNIVEIIAGLYGEKVNFSHKSKQYAIAPKHYAYLKIADGCNNACAYCTIPRLRGRYVSTPIEKVVERAKQLCQNGAKELIVVAQDVTRYGQDIYGEPKLEDLLTKLTQIKEVEWVRVHYCYPELVTNSLLTLFSTNPKICPYIDIPLQHIDNKILKDMNRRTSEQEVRNLVDNIKTNFPQISIRSTFIVGFPGETRKQFNKLCKFLKTAKLDNVGFFAYSKEESTKAFYMRKQVPEFIKKLRLKKIQKIQAKVALENNLKQIGTTHKVLVDSFNSQTGLFEARTAKMSPEVDFCVKIPCSENVEIGKFYNVVLTDFVDYYFIGETLKD